MVTNSLKRKGREYVTGSEFARRMNVAKSTISEYIKKGKLQTTDIGGELKGTWLDYEQQKIQFLALARMPQRAPKKNRKKKEEIVIKGKGTPKPPSIKAIDTLEITEDRQIKGEIIDANKLNPYDYPECWIFRDEKVVYNPNTKLPMLDYEKLKAYLTNMKYQLDIKKAKEEVIDKRDVAFAISNCMQIFSKELIAIPRKYGDTIIAFLELKTKHKLSAEDRTELTNILNSKPFEIMEEIKKSFEALVDE